MLLSYRIIRHQDGVKVDFNHPIKTNFFAAISISMLLLAQAYLEISTPISFTLWILGAFLQLTLVILSKLIWTFSFKMEQFNPTWFIPIVGNIVVPLAGSSYVIADINWMFSVWELFSVSFIRSYFQSYLFSSTISV